MARNEISLTLDGVVPLELYNKALDHFTALVLNLSAEIVGENVIEWTITDLRYGSAFNAVAGVAQHMEDVDRVVQAYIVTAQAISSGQPVPYSEFVEREAIEITSILNGKVTAVRFGADGQEVQVSEPIKIEETLSGYNRELGVIQGIVRSIASTTSIVMGVYDDLFGKRIECTLNRNQEQLARDIWLKRVAITGLIRRDPESGRATSITEVSNIEVIEDTSDTFYSLRGSMKWQEGDERAEETIRRIRDGL